MIHGFNGFTLLCVVAYVGAILALRMWARS